jgi:hypothetical protein
MILVKLSEGIAPSAGLQNRACHFHSTRLLRRVGLCHKYPPSAYGLVTVYLVVTVTMDRHQIAVGVISSPLLAMMYLQNHLWQEDEIAIATASVFSMP